MLVGTLNLMCQEFILIEVARVVNMDLELIREVWVVRILRDTQGFTGGDDIAKEGERV